MSSPFNFNLLVFSLQYDVESGVLLRNQNEISTLPIGQSTCNVNGLWDILAVIVPSIALDVNCEPERNLRKCCYKDIQICCKNSRRLGTRKLSTMTQVLNYKVSSYQIKESITHLMQHTFTILVPLILFALKRERKRSFFLSFFLFFFDQELRWGEACSPPLCTVSSVPVRWTSHGVN